MRHPRRRSKQSQKRKPISENNQEPSLSLQEPEGDIDEIAEVCQADL